VRSVPRLSELYPGICLTTEEKSRKNLNQRSETPEFNRTSKAKEKTETANLVSFI